MHVLGVTSDGHALAVAASNGFSVWSVYGRLQTSAVPPEPDSHEAKFEDYFMGSCRSLFWGPGNFELFLLTPPTPSSTRYIADDQLFVLPFAQSAVATLHSPVRPVLFFSFLGLMRLLIFKGFFFFFIRTIQSKDFYS